MKRILSHYCGAYVTAYFYISIGLLACLWRSRLLSSDIIGVLTFCFPIVSGVLTFVFLMSHNVKEFFEKFFRYLWMSLLTFVILEIIIGIYRSLFFYSLGAVWATDAQLGLGEIFSLIIAELFHLGLSVIGIIGSGCVSFYRQRKIKQSKVSRFVERKANCE